MDYHDERKRDRLLRKVQAKIRHHRSLREGAPSLHRAELQGQQRPGLLQPPSAQDAMIFGPLVREVMGVWEEERHAVLSPAGTPAAPPPLGHLAAWALAGRPPCRDVDPPLAGRVLLFHHLFWLLLDSGCPGLPRLLLDACLEHAAVHQVMDAVYFAFGRLNRHTSHLPEGANAYSLLFTQACQCRRATAFLAHMTEHMTVEHARDPAFQQFLPDLLQPPNARFLLQQPPPNYKPGTATLPLLRAFIRLAPDAGRRARRQARHLFQLLFHHASAFCSLWQETWCIPRTADTECAWRWMLELVQDEWAALRWTGAEVLHAILLALSLARGGVGLNRSWVAPPLLPAGEADQQLWARTVDTVARLNPTVDDMLESMISCAYLVPTYPRKEVPHARQGLKLACLWLRDWDHWLRDLPGMRPAAAMCCRCILPILDKEQGLPSYTTDADPQSLSVATVLASAHSLGDPDYEAIALRDWELEPVTDTWILKRQGRCTLLDCPAWRLLPERGLWSGSSPSGTDDDEEEDDDEDEEETTSDEASAESDTVSLVSPDGRARRLPDAFLVFQSSDPLLRQPPTSPPLPHQRPSSPATTSLSPPTTSSSSAESSPTRRTRGRRGGALAAGAAAGDDSRARFEDVEGVEGDDDDEDDDEEEEDLLVAAFRPGPGPTAAPAPRPRMPLSPIRTRSGRCVAADVDPLCSTDRCMVVHGRLPSRGARCPTASPSAEARAVTRARARRLHLALTVPAARGGRASRVYASGPARRRSASPPAHRPTLSYRVRDVPSSSSTSTSPPSKRPQQPLLRSYASTSGPRGKENAANLRRPPPRPSTWLDGESDDDLLRM